MAFIAESKAIIARIMSAAVVFISALATLAGPQPVSLKDRQHPKTRFFVIVLAQIIAGLLGTSASAITVKVVSRSSQNRLGADCKRVLQRLNQVN